MNNKVALIAVRDAFQSLLDNYQVMDTAMVAYKGAMVGLNSIIETPDAPAVTVQQPVVGTADVIAGVLAGLGDLGDSIGVSVLGKVQPALDAVTGNVTALTARVTALTPPPPIDPVVLAPTADQLAAAQAVIAAAAASQQPAAAAPAADASTAAA